MALNKTSTHSYVTDTLDTSTFEEGIKIAKAISTLHYFNQNFLDIRFDADLLEREFYIELAKRYIFEESIENSTVEDYLFEIGKKLIDEN